MPSTSIETPSSQPIERRLVQKREAALMLSITVRQLDRIRADDPLFPAPVMLGPRKVRFQVEDIDAYIAARKREPMLTPAKPRSVFDLGKGGSTSSLPQSQMGRSAEKVAQSASPSAA